MSDTTDDPTPGQEPADRAEELRTRRMSDTTDDLIARACKMAEGFDGGPIARLLDDLAAALEAANDPSRDNEIAAAAVEIERDRVYVIIDEMPNIHGSISRDELRRRI